MDKRMDTSNSKALKLHNANKVFKDLFAKAKDKDEFEYCCALLRIRGSQGSGWDTMEESYQLITQSIEQASASSDNGFRVRLLLLAYCHAIEMNFTYDMIANMIQISQGDRYCMNWFSAETLSAKKPRKYPMEKIEKIQEWAKLANQEPVGQILDEMLAKDIRNAFTHSSYILYKDEMRILEPEKIPKIYKFEILIPILEFGINNILMLISLTGDEIRSYKENKKVFSRMLEGDPFCEMELYITPGFGLTGFRSKPKGY